MQVTDIPEEDLNRKVIFQPQSPPLKVQIEVGADKRRRSCLDLVFKGEKEIEADRKVQDLAQQPDRARSTGREAWMTS